MGISLILGGARSGKSRFAEAEADHWKEKNGNQSRVYVATAQIFDEEMRQRVTDHKVQRGSDWLTVEEPFNLVQALQDHANTNRFILVDCLTLWLTNLLLDDQNCTEAITELCASLNAIEGEIVLVSNEVGLGIVPENKLARQFRDIQGKANQEVAAVADRVVFIAAGLPMVLKAP